MSSFAPFNEEAVCYIRTRQNSVKGCTVLNLRFVAHVIPLGNTHLCSKDNPDKWGWLCTNKLQKQVVGWVWLVHPCILRTSGSFTQ